MTTSGSTATYKFTVTNSTATNDTSGWKVSSNTADTADVSYTSGTLNIADTGNTATNSGIYYLRPCGTCQCWTDFGDAGVF